MYDKVVLALFIVVWYAYSNYVVAIVFSFRLFMGSLLLHLLEFFSNFSEMVDPRLLAIGELNASMTYMRSVPPESVDIKSFNMVSAAYGAAYAVPNIIVGVIGTVYAMFFHRFSKFTKTHSMTSLSKQEVVNWPQIACTLGRDLIKEDITKKCSSSL